jgi:hypothetical protein
MSYLGNEAARPQDHGSPTVDTDHSVPFRGDAENVLREHYPVVSVDIGMGKKFRDVSFDYEAFEREADRMGMPIEASSALTIKLPGIRFFKSSRGSYSPRKSLIEAGINRQKQANKTLRHELRHAADDANGSLEIDARHVIGSLATRIGGPVGNGYMLGQATELLGKHPFLVDSLPYRSTFIVLGGLSVWGYVFHPMERRARKSARQNKEPIITLEKRGSIISRKFKG